MHFKRYIALSILFLIIVSVYTYLNINTLYSMDFFGLVVELPVALWVVVPATLILFVSVLHFAFYAVLEFFKHAMLEKDLNKITNMVKNALLNKRSVENIKDARLKLLTELFANSSLQVDKNYSFENGELNEIVSAIRDIENGEFVDLSKYKLEKDNSLYIKNQFNRLKSDPLSAERILKECYDDSELCMSAFEEYVKAADKKKINKISLKKTKRIVIAMLERLNSEQYQLDFSKEEIISLCKEVDFSQDDFIQVAKILQKNMDPDELLELCFLLQKEIESACTAYLYVNLELERNNIAREYLEQFAEDELMKFRYYILLKQSGQKIALSNFV